jgi:hypothetical protein
MGRSSGRSTTLAMIATLNHRMTLDSVESPRSPTGTSTAGSWCALGVLVRRPGISLMGSVPVLRVRIPRQLFWPTHRILFLAWS